MPSGSIPGATSLPFTELFRKTEITTQDGHAEAVYLPRPRRELIRLFSARGVHLGEGQPDQTEGQVGAMCGSGITACPLALILCTLGRPDVPIYDGSWCVSASCGWLST